MTLIFLVVILTLLVAAYFTNEDVVAMAGCVLFIIYFIVHLAFQGGAEWQKADTNEKYNLTPKTNVK